MRFLCVLSLLLACGSAAIAGPPFPCFKAMSSKNGNFLVVIDPYVPGRERVTLQIWSKGIFLNESQRLSGPATYWGGQAWSVVVDAVNMRSEPEQCPLPLITDDGEYLIIVHTGPTYSGGAAVLQIYRRRDHLGDPIREGPDHGIFIREIALREVWTADRVAALPSGWTD